MSGDRPGPTEAVPVLTEVVSMPGPAREAVPARVAEAVPAREAAAADDARIATPPSVQPGPAEPESRIHEPAAWPGEEALVRRVLGEVQRQVDGVLEYRVREVLTPILTRATDAVVREARHELARSLRDVVAQCVTQELQRQRSR